MKKNDLLLIISILIVSILSVSGCSKKEETNSEKAKDIEKQTENTPMNLTLLGMSASGPGLIMMNGVAECINKSYPNSVVTIVPGNNGTNVPRINNNEADIAMSDNVFTSAGAAGEAPYDKKMDNLASLAVMQPQVFQIVANSNLGIDSFDQIIKNKMKVRISLGLAGGAWPYFFEKLLAEYGLTIDDMSNWGCEILYQGIGDSCQMLSDDRIDVIVAAVFVPTPNIQELSKNKDIVLLKLEPEMINNLCEKYGYFNSDIKTEYYDFLDEDIPSLHTNSILIVPKNSSDENVYKITKSIVENLDYLKTVHSSFADISEEKLVEDLDYPLHPGAEKYYREKGIIK